MKKITEFEIKYLIEEKWKLDHMLELSKYGDAEVKISVEEEEEEK